MWHSHRWDLGVCQMQGGFACCSHSYWCKKKSVCWNHWHTLPFKGCRHLLQDLQLPCYPGSYKKSIKLSPSSSCITALNSDRVLSRTAQTGHWLKAAQKLLLYSLERSHTRGCTEAVSQSRAVGVISLCRSVSPPSQEFLSLRCSSRQALSVQGVLLLLPPHFII